MTFDKVIVSTADPSGFQYLWGPDLQRVASEQMIQNCIRQFLEAYLAQAPAQ